MFDGIFTGVFDTSATAPIDAGKFMLCILVSLILGFLIALCYCGNSRYTRSYLATLFMLPAVVCVVIMMVNGNVGAGVAVAGAFSLVRFRSVPGSAREITMLFLAMGAGLICGMGYLGYAAAFTLTLCLVSFAYDHLVKTKPAVNNKYKTLQITIPEDLDYSSVFDDIISKYTDKCELVRVKTTNLGSMFRLTYEIVLRDPKQEKEMIDLLRCRNGNLEIMVSRMDTTTSEL